MRQNGVRGLEVTCRACGHHTEVKVDAWPDDVSVPSLGPVCAVASAPMRGPNGSERRDYLPGGAKYVWLL
jgi:hypothetical protein